MWRRLDHPNVVPLQGIIISPLRLILDWMPGGDLMVYIKKIPDAYLPGIVGLSLPNCALRSYPFSCRTLLKASTTSTLVKSSLGILRG